MTNAGERLSNIRDALRALGASQDLLSNQNKSELDEKGYTVLPGIIDGEWLQALRVRFEELCQAEGPSAGIEGVDSETSAQEVGARRLDNLVNKGQVFDRVYTHPMVLAAAYQVIGRDFKMSSLSARDALPGKGHQALHPDWITGYEGQFHVCNSIWMLDDFTEDNGPTRLVPGTHRDDRPQYVLDDPSAPHPKEEYLMAPSGSVGVFNGHIWHGGTQNRTDDKPRRALHCYFAAREHAPLSDQRNTMLPETWERISPAARYILDVDVD